MNNPNGAGKCTAGPVNGCSCTSVCGTTNGPCNLSGCQGINDPTTGLGTCTAPDLIGCNCASVCGATNGSCNDNGCAGVNGVCTAGDINGCFCNE